MLKVTISKQTQGVSFTALQRQDIEIPAVVFPVGGGRYPDDLKAFGCSENGNLHRLFNGFGELGKDVPAAQQLKVSTLLEALRREDWPRVQHLIHRVEMAADTAKKKVPLLREFYAACLDESLKFGWWRSIVLRCKAPVAHWFIINRDARRGAFGRNEGTQSRKIEHHEGYVVGPCPHHSGAARQKRWRARAKAPSKFT